MSHEVENMFSVKETPWHGLGVIVQEAPSAAEAIKVAGLDWKVLEQMVYRVTGPNSSERIESHKALVRNDNDKVLGVVGRDYHPLQNDKAFAFFNPFVESGLAQFETAGCLREGKTVWVLAKLNKAPIDIGGGDRVTKYLLLSNGHDGTMAVRVGFTPIRVVCANTLAMSHDKKESRLLRLFHSKQVDTRLEAVQQIINAADARFEATAEQYRALAKSDVDQKALEAYVQVIFPFNTINDVEQRKLATERMTQDIQKIFETGYGMDLKAARGTYWGLYNAVTQYLSYDRGRAQDSRLNSLWFGDAKNLNQKALDEALVAVAR